MNSLDNELMSPAEIAKYVGKKRTNIYYYLHRFKPVTSPIPEKHGLYRFNDVSEWWLKVKEYQENRSKKPKTKEQ